MTQGVNDLINAIVEGDATKIDAAFNSEMAIRISDKLEDMRVSVGQSMFATEQVEEQTEEVAEEQTEEVAEEQTEETTEEIAVEETVEAQAE
jgi:division protein CdvB (Snf7/Vps24/ESCRT-III family)